MEVQFGEGCVPIDGSIILHAAVNEADAAVEIWFVVVGVGPEWPGKGDGKEDGLVFGERGCGMMEIVLAGSLAAIDTETELYDVEIDLHDAAFAPEQFNQDHIVGLHHFAEKGAAVGKETVFCGLLADAAATTQGTATLIHTISHTETLKQKATAVGKEFDVFGAVDGTDQIGGDGLKGDKTITFALTDGIGSTAVLTRSMNHQGGDDRGKELAINHLNQRDEPKGKDEPSQDAQKKNRTRTTPKQKCENAKRKEYKETPSASKKPPTAAYWGRYFRTQKSKHHAWCINKLG